MQENYINQIFSNLMNMGQNFHVLENQVPIEQQIEYFNYTFNVRKRAGDLNDGDYEQLMIEMENPYCTNDEKKRILALLSTSKDVKIFRFIEQYSKEPDKGLENWANMCLMESRIMMESELSGTHQAYISTGLGGKGDKLRFYVLLLATDAIPFLDYQRDIIKSEFAYILEQYDCEAERIKIKENYVELIMLAPIFADFRHVLEKAVKECNVYGNFLSDYVTVTNAKILGKSTVNKILESYKNNVVNKVN